MRLHPSLAHCHWEIANLCAAQRKVRNSNRGHRSSSTFAVMAEDMAPSCSEDDEVVSDDDGELPAPMPLEMLNGGRPSSTLKPAAPKPVAKPAAKPASKPAPKSVSKAPAAGAKLNPFQAAISKKKQPAPPKQSQPAAAPSPSPPPQESAAPAANVPETTPAPDTPGEPTNEPATESVADPTNDPTEEATQMDTGPEVDSDEDDAKLTTPAMMPEHVPISEPVADEDSSEPFDAAKAAEMARKNASGMGVSGSAHPSVAGQASVVTPVVAEKTPGVVDEALRNLMLMLKGEKNDSIAQMPMCRLLHGLVKDDEGNAWPPYDITLHESRHSQSQRIAWLNEHMLKDPSRIFNTILIFDIGSSDGASNSDTAPNENVLHLQAVLPGVMANPDSNADTHKRMGEYNDAIGSTDWTFAIPVPAQFVKSMYKQHKHGLPTIYDPSNSNVKYQLIAKIEDQCAKNSLWKLVVDKSREGQASVAAANGSSTGRSKRAAGIEDGQRKRSASAASATKSAPVTESSAPVSHAPTVESSAESSAKGQSTLSFSAASPTPTSEHSPPLETFRTVVVETAHEESQPVARWNGGRPSSPAAPAVEQTRALVPSVQMQRQPEFVHSSLPWTAISPEWFSVVLPKLPKGYTVEMSAPTAHCSGLVSFKRSESSNEHDL